MSRALVVGAGIGGLAAAVDLAGKGVAVEVFEAHDRVGGKASEQCVDGACFDTGPSLLTLPEVFRDLFARTEADLRDYVELITPSPLFRYRWPDGTDLPVHHALDDTLDSVRDTLGPDAADQLQRFLRRARTTWELSAPRFVLGDAPTLGGVLRMGPLAWLELGRVDVLRSMQRAIERDVSEPHLRDLLLRYATYNGSDPRRAPATLNCIAWVELGLGGYGVRGGMHQLALALVKRLEELGGAVHTNTPVDALITEGGRVTGLRTADQTHHADAVVVNADVAHLLADLLPGSLKTPRTARSTSGLTLVVRSKRRTDRAAHTVVYPEDYLQEFRDLYDHRKPPSDPTLYACAQGVAHGREGWGDDEPVFLMANAPADPDASCDALREALLRRAVDSGVIDAGDRVVWERDPAGLEALYPRTGGAIYGAASTDRMAAFKRPPNRAPLPGLYLAGGSAHPGGGVPLCAQSGATAARQLLHDLGAAR